MPEQDYSDEPVGSGRMSVIGDDLSGSTDSGSAPVKIGGVTNTGTPSLATTGQRKESWVGAHGALVICALNLGSGGSDGQFMSYLPQSDTSIQARPVAVAPYVSNGTTWDRPRTPTVFKSLSAVVITSETTIWTPTGGKKFRLMGFCLTQGVVTGAITLKDNTGGSTILIIPPHTIGVMFTSPPMGNGILSGAADRVLTATGASTETITGYVFGTEE